MLKDYNFRLNCVPPKEVVVSRIDTDESPNKRLDIDPFGTAKSLLNPCGWPMNDIMAFEESQSESVARTILQRVKVIPDSGLTNDGRSIEEHFADLCPSNWSSPAEFIRYQKKVAENYYKRAEAKAERARQIAEEKAAAAIKESQVITASPE